jgi:hypothetical protein
MGRSTSSRRPSVSTRRAWAGSRPANAGDPALFQQAAAQGRLGAYQLLGAIGDGQPIGERF